MLIRSKAPFRISFGGGGTDIEPYCVNNGGCVINTTIDRHVHITIEPREDKKVKVISKDFNEELTFDIGDRDYSQKFELFKGVINVLDIKEGFNITAYSELPAGSGMGGSSSLTVALIGAFNKYYNLGLNEHEIAQKAYGIERIELNQKGGYQDQFAASYGGFNFIEFTDQVNVFPIVTSQELLNELQYRLILCYVGGSHFSEDIHEDVLKRYHSETRSYLKFMHELKAVALRMKEIVENKNISDLRRFGELLHKGWLAKKNLSSKISNNKIETYYNVSRKHGVIGGKLLGAGGGGHLLLFSDPKKKYDVIRELAMIGGEIVNFHFNPKGLETWCID